MTHHLSDNGFVYNETCIKCTCTLIYIYIYISIIVHMYIYMCVYIYATPLNLCFRSCDPAWRHTAMLQWFEQRRRQVLLMTRPRWWVAVRNKMTCCFLAMISIQKSTDKVVYDNYPLHPFWPLFMWSKATVTRGFCVDFEKWASRLFSWRRWWMTSVQT